MTITVAGNKKDVAGEIFKVFKGMFARIFMTGVSPVTLDDLTSGFNIGWHISTKAPFNQMLGFKTCILPGVCLKNIKKNDKIEIIGVNNVQEAIKLI